jgi:amidohydrolase
VSLRRRLHQIPEVGLHLPETQRAILNELDGLPIEQTVLGESLSSIAVVIRGGLPGPTVLLRSDMDALAVEERTGLPFASTNGAMHACGHDLHMAALVGAVRLLCSRKEELEGTVIAVFQPGEEGYGGAEAMLAEGVLGIVDEPPVASYGIHVFSFLPAGEFACRDGVVMAATMNFDIEIVGSGGHAARPHAAQNPIITGSLIVQGIQSYVAQKTQPSAPIVATVGAFVGGSAANVIPDRAVLRVSVRALTAESVREVFTEVTSLAASIAAGYRLNTIVEAGPMMVPTISSAQDSELVREVVVESFGTTRYRELVFPEMIAEDFSQFLNTTGGAFVFLGAAISDRPLAELASNHSPMAEFDDGVLLDAALFLSELATRRLRTQPDESGLNQTASR